MKKHVLLAVLVGIVVLSFASCGRETPSDGSSSPASTSPKTETAASEASSPVSEKSTEATAESSSGGTAESSPSPSAQDAAESADTPTENGITLESVKKAALDAGFAAEDIPQIEVQTDPVPVRGIFVNYADETLQSQCPVYEFKDAADAMAFARQVNDSGYSLCVINDKLVAMTDAKYGIILHDKEKAVLEGFLASRFMTYEEPAAPPANLDKDYAGAAARIEVMRQALAKRIEKSVILHAKTLPPEEQQTLSFISFSLAGSADLSFTAPLCEDQAKIDAVIDTWTAYGCTDVKISHEKPHSYTMTGKRAGMDDPFTLRCVYSPEQDAVSLLDTSGKELLEFFECVPLGNDRYALQTLYERAILVYKDGKITSLDYSLKPRSREFAYDPDTDAIFPNGKGVDDAWVSESGKDAFEQRIVFEGNKLQISALDFTGTKLEYAIEVQE